MILKLLKIRKDNPMYLIFDTETSNLPQDNIELSHPCQCRMLQLACILLDKEFKEVACFNFLLKVPEGTQIHPKAFDAHGITVDKCRQYGVEHEHVFNIFNSFVKNSEVMVGFNIQFDKKVIDIEHRLLTDNSYEYNGHKFCCCMESTTPIVQMPFANGRKVFGQRFKWPKLEEAYAYLFHKTFEGAHDALRDVRATSEIFHYLVENDAAKFI